MRYEFMKSELCAQCPAWLCAAYTRQTLICGQLLPRELATTGHPGQSGKPTLLNKLSTNLVSEWTAVDSDATNASQKEVNQVNIQVII